MTTHVQAEFPRATDGAIAAANLESARRRGWARFTRDATLPGIAESVVDMERLRIQFLGDPESLDRLEVLALELVDGSPRSSLVHAAVASTAHRFEDARRHLSHAATQGAPGEAIEHASLAIDQACGMELDRVLDARWRIAASSGTLDDLVPLGALLADLGRFPEADSVYRQGLHSHSGVSPFPLAWVCFQLGMLWGELVPEPDLERAACWYEQAISYLPAHTKARVHLAEIRLHEGRAADAEALLLPALGSGDPEVRWRLSDVLSAQGRFGEAGAELCAAWGDFDRVVTEHPLAFADHAAEFYAGSGHDRERALELSLMNVANRPTRRAIEQLHAILGQDA